MLSKMVNSMDKYKVSFLVVAVLALAGYFFHLHMEWKRHNLYVHNSIIGCFQDFDRLDRTGDWVKAVCRGDKVNMYVLPEYLNMPYAGIREDGKEVEVKEEKRPSIWNKE